MAYLRVVEHRIRLGQSAQYLAAIQTLATACAAIQSVTMCQVNEDVDCVLVFFRFFSRNAWQAQYDAFERCLEATTRPLVAEEISCAGFTPVREIERMLEPPAWLGGRIIEVAPAEIDRYIEWASAIQDRMFALPEVTAVRLLRADDHPSRLVTITEYRSVDALPKIRALLELESPVPRAVLQGFFGAVHHRWEGPPRLD